MKCKEDQKVFPSSSVFVFAGTMSVMQECFHILILTFSYLFFLKVSSYKNVRQIKQNPSNFQLSV